jgi:hypothetical protein
MNQNGFFMIILQVKFELAVYASLEGFFFLISFSLNLFRANEAKQMLITEPSLVVLFVTYFYSETQSQRTY